MFNLAKYNYLINLLAGGVIILIPGQDNSVLAQITPDNTLGQENSQVNSVSQQEKQISGGAIRGTNLFHSFSEFNVGEAETVNFTNPEGIANIFSRVTGNNISQILGDLGVLGNANLFLINPNGIFFGEQASLNVNGSFLATTANSIVFAYGLQFLANPANEAPLLTISLPVGLQFGNQPGEIINQAQSYEDPPPEPSSGLVAPAGLKIKSNQTLALIGGEIRLEGGNLTALGGKIELGSVAANSLVNFQVTESGFDFDYSAVENFLDITATSREDIVFEPELAVPSIVNATSEETSGTINVHGRNINILNGSQLLTPTLGKTPGGNLTVNAVEQITLDGSASTILSSTVGDGNAGYIKISTKRLIIQNFATIDSNSAATVPSTGEEILATGDAGNIDIVASELISLTNEGTINSNSLGNKKAGSINLKTETLNIDDNSEVNVSNSKAGEAGDIFIQAQSLNLNRNSSISATTKKNDGGNINLQIAENLEIRNQSNISASVGDDGNGGNINIAAQFLITSPQDNSDITANAKLGNGGNISINALGVFGISEQDKVTQFSDITASSDFGLDGTVTLTNSEIKSQTTETKPNIQLVEQVSSFAPNSCYAKEQSQYIQTGRGGLPLASKSIINTEHTWEDWRIIDESESEPEIISDNSSQTKHNNNIQASINPIQGWMVNQRGEVTLTANSLVFTPHPLEATSSGCN